MKIRKGRKALNSDKEVKSGEASELERTGRKSKKLTKRKEERGNRKWGALGRNGR